MAELHRRGHAPWFAARCEECEYEAALMAYRAGLGASEWEAFIDRVPPCDGCRQVAVLLGAANNQESPS